MNLKNNKSAFLDIGWFVPAIFGAVILAYYFPHLSKIQKPLSLAEIANYGISGIFFFYGLKLNVQKLKTGLTNWRVHALIQTTTFLVFPLLIILIRPFFYNDASEKIWLGLFFLAALPSTVSSSVVMVSLAGGNIPSAIFNASISAFIGIVVTPLWLGLYLQSTDIQFELTTVILKLTFQVIIPVLIGLLLNKYLGLFAEKHKKKLQVFDQIIILLIIYISFCKSFSEKLFHGMSIVEIALLASGMLVLFCAVVLFGKVSSNFLKFNREDTTTVIFCGSKKSLVHGSVMAGIIFAGNPISGYVLLPLMLYHAIQLIISAFLAKNMSRMVFKREIKSKVPK